MHRSERQSPPARPLQVRPIQARPVVRDERAEVAVAHADGGVIAAQSTCAGLTGMARQLCYSAQYGVSI